ncbi:MAG: hypothetical protein ACREBZ_04370 [Thermoplasmata archaeon]
MISARTIGLIAAAVLAGAFPLVIPAGLEIQEFAGGTALLLGLAAGCCLYLDYWPSERPAPPTEIEFEFPRFGPPGAEGALRGNPIARESLVFELDTIERSGFRPDLPTTTVEEVRRITRMSSSDFRAYVEERLDRLERQT